MRQMALLIVLLLLVCGWGSAQTESSKKTRVRVFIPEQGIRDPHRAALYAITAVAIPPEEWPTIGVEQTTTVTNLVDQYFEIYPGRTRNAYGANPQTSALLNTLIRRINKLSDDIVRPTKALKLPPLPVRGFTKYDEEVRIRDFDPQVQRYSLMISDSHQVTSPTRTMRPASEMGTWRPGKITSVALQMDENLEAEAAKTLPLAAIPISDDSFDLIHLLDNAPASCSDGTSWLATSAYFPTLQTRMAALSQAAIAPAASRQRLVIIDWDFQSPSGHGKKVLSVVKQVLTQLRLASLISDSNIETVDLHPKRGEQKLRPILEQYEQFFASLPEWHGANLTSIFADAFNWLGKDPDEEDAKEQKVPSLVLQAVFWKYFAGRNVVNLSFSIESTAFGVANPRFMTGTASFGVLAAGNSGLELSTVMLPQAEASSWPSLLNVTHGERDGTILGDYTNERYGRPVHVIGPGCGYQFEAITPADIGSSFASPYVAVAAWLLRLAAKSSITVSEIKRQLVLSTMAAPPKADRVQSGGVFDFPELFSQSAAHFIDSQGRLVSLKTASMTVRYRSAGVEASITFAVTPTITGKSFALFTCANNQTCLWFRDWKIGDGAPNRIEGPITGLDFVGTTVDGQAVVFHSPSQFQQRVRQLNF